MPSSCPAGLGTPSDVHSRRNSLAFVMTQQETWKQRMRRHLRSRRPFRTDQRMRVATRVRRFSFVFPFFLFGVNETSVGSPFDLFSSDNTHSASGLDPRKSPPPKLPRRLQSISQIVFFRYSTTERTWHSVMSCDLTGPVLTSSPQSGRFVVSDWNCARMNLLAI